MVTRIGDTINFDIDEQLEFNVDPEVSAVSAYETAVVYDAVAKRLDARATEVGAQVGRDSFARANAWRSRAARLDMISKEILGLVAPDIAASAAVLLYTDDN